ncbi:O-antigen ligase family protein [Terrisporobacter sp.]
MISIIIISTISIIMYIVGIDGIVLGLHPKIINSQTNMQWYGERRIQWLYEHKIQFSATCLIGIFLIVNNKELKLLKKGVFLLIVSYAIYLSNSKIALVGILLVFVFKLLVNNIDNFKKIDSSVKLLFWYTTLCISVLCILVLLMYSGDLFEYIGKTRDIRTLGNRMVIWENVIYQIKRNSFGIIKSYGTTFNNGLFLYSTAHNTILNEFLETGIVGGSLYLIIVIISCSMIKEGKNMFIFMLLFGLGLSDYLISGLFSYIFWFYTSILISESNIRNNTKNILVSKHTMCFNK